MSDPTHLGTTVRRLVDTMDAYGSDFLANHELSFTQYRIMAVLHETPGVPGKRVAHCLGISGAAISKQLRKMLERGIVEDASAPGSGNTQELALTTRGSALYLELRPRLLAPLREIATSGEVNPDELALKIHEVNLLYSADLPSEETGLSRIGLNAPAPTPSVAPDAATGLEPRDVSE